MTKTNTKSNATKSTNAKKNTKTNVAPRTNANIALKTMHDDIMKANKSSTIDTKKMRVYLRKNYAHIHERNSSWMFTQNEYDEIRSHFDPTYAKKQTRSNNRAKKNVQSNVAPIVETTNVENVE